MISLIYRGKLYNIPQEPFEPIEESYTRAWYIVKRYTEASFPELYSASIMMINKNKGMVY